MASFRLYTRKVGACKQRRLQVLQFLGVDSGAFIARMPERLPGVRNEEMEIYPLVVAELARIRVFATEEARILAEFGYNQRPDRFWPGPILQKPRKSPVELGHGPPDCEDLAWKGSEGVKGVRFGG
jgi:hypothetical protein